MLCLCVVLCIFIFLLLAPCSCSVFLSSNTNFPFLYRVSEKVYDLITLQLCLFGTFVVFHSISFVIILCLCFVDFWLTWRIIWVHIMISVCQAYQLWGWAWQKLTSAFCWRLHISFSLCMVIPLPWSSHFHTSLVYLHLSFVDLDLMSRSWGHKQAKLQLFQFKLVGFTRLYDSWKLIPKWGLLVPWV